MAHGILILDILVLTNVVTLSAGTIYARKSDNTETSLHVAIDKADEVLAGVTENNVAHLRLITRLRRCS